MTHENKSVTAIIPDTAKDSNALSYAIRILQILED